MTWLMRKHKVKDYLNSFFKEKIIEIFESDINPPLEVSLINGRYQLNAGSVNYSFGPLHDAFRKYFVKDPPLLNEKSEVLILGLGAGSVVHILRNELNLISPITGVEIDKVVINAARKHFSLDSIKDLKVIIDDALLYLQTSDDSYDFIVIDIYIDDLVPPKFETLEFIHLLANHITADGKVVFNKLHQINYDDASIRILKKYFEKVFDQTEIIKVSVNKQNPNYFITGNKKKKISL